MNSILQLKGQFEQQNGAPGGGKRNIPVGGSVQVEHLIDLRNDLRSLLSYWSGQQRQLSELHTSRQITFLP